MEIIYEESIFGGVCIKFEEGYDLFKATMATYHHKSNELYINDGYRDRLSDIDMILFELGLFIDGKLLFYDFYTNHDVFYNKD